MHKFITPRVGSDGYFPVCVGGSREFQSTLPVWGATSDRPVLHAPQRISIHAPRVGSDSTLVCSYPHEEEFQSTLPVWGATRITFDGLQLPPDFNPRSPCGERPQSSATSKCEQRHFNPRSPCGERRFQIYENQNKFTISIHAPRVGSDSHPHAKILYHFISIHAPRVGSDYPAS